MYSEYYTQETLYVYIFELTAVIYQLEDTNKSGLTLEELSQINANALAQNSQSGCNLLVGFFVVVLGQDCICHCCRRGHEDTKAYNDVDHCEDLSCRCFR